MRSTPETENDVFSCCDLLLTLSAAGTHGSSAYKGGHEDPAIKNCNNTQLLGGPAPHPSQFSARWSPAEPTCGRQGEADVGELRRRGREAARHANRQANQKATANCQAVTCRLQAAAGLHRQYEQSGCCTTMGVCTCAPICCLRVAATIQATNERTLPRWDTSVRDHSARARSNEVVSRLTSLAEGPCNGWGRRAGAVRQVALVAGC